MNVSIDSGTVGTIAIIDSGGRAGTGQGFNVLKRELVSSVQAALQTNRLIVSRKLSEANVLVTELQNFRAEISDPAAIPLLEAVIGLGLNLFYGTGLAACILVFRQRKAKDRKNKVLIVDASKEFKTGRAQNELLPQHVEHIHHWYRDFGDVDGIARVVTLDEIAGNDHNLNIPRYVEPKVPQEVPTLDEAMKRLQVSAQAAFEAEDTLVEILENQGLLSRE